MQTPDQERLQIYLAQRQKVREQSKHVANRSFVNWLVSRINTLFC